MLNKQDAGKLVNIITNGPLKLSLDDFLFLTGLIDRQQRAIEIMANQMECGCECQNHGPANDCTLNLTRELRKAMKVMK